MEVLTTNISFKNTDKHSSPPSEVMIEMVITCKGGSDRCLLVGGIIVALIKIQCFKVLSRQKLITSLINSF